MLKEVIQISSINKKKIKLFFSRRYLLNNRKDRWHKHITLKNRASTNFFNFNFNFDDSFFLKLKTYNNFSNIAVYNATKKYFSKICYFLILKNNFMFWIPVVTGDNFFYNKCFSSISFKYFSFFLFDFGLLNILKKWYKLILKNIFHLIFLKFRYKGKNYRWHRRKKGVLIRFGHSHLIVRKKPISVFLKKKSKMKMLFFGTNIFLIKLFLKNLIQWKPANVYTGRGLRLSRQRMMKKAGKVSIYR